MKLNIYKFEFGVCEMVIAPSKKEAIKEHMRITGWHKSEYDISQINLIPQKNWDDYTYFNEDNDIPEDAPITFRQYMNDFKPTGTMFFCSTED